jgi:hypothetical protein
MKYLVVKCNELDDQWECDADREPVCLTDDFEKFNKYGYEIYEITSENTFELIKRYEEFPEEEMAIYKWYDSDKVEEQDEPDEIIVIKKHCTIEDYTKSEMEQIRSDYHFKDSIDDICMDIWCSDVHAEEIEGEWVVIGEHSKGFPWKKGF